MDAGEFWGHKISASHLAMVDSIPPNQVDSFRLVSVLGLKLDHDRNEFRLNLNEKLQNFDANVMQITRQDIVLLASQIFATQGFVSPS